MTWKTKLITGAAAIAFAWPGLAAADEATDARIKALEEQLELLQSQIADLKQSTANNIADVRKEATATTVSLNGHRVELTAREWAVLEALVRRAGRIVPKGDLEALVLGLGGEVASNSIEVHVCRLRRKLGRGLVQTVRGIGYRLAD